MGREDGKGGTGVIARENTYGREVKAIVTEAKAVLHAVELAVHYKWSDV